MVIITAFITQKQFNRFNAWLTRIFNKKEQLIINEFKLLNQKLNKTYTFNNFMDKINATFENLPEDLRPAIYFKAEAAMIYLNSKKIAKLNIDWDHYFKRNIDALFDEISYSNIDEKIKTELLKHKLFTEAQLKKMHKMILLETGSLIIGIGFIPDALLNKLRNNEIENIMNRLFLKIPNIYNRAKLLDEAQRSLEERKFLIQLGTDISSTLSLRKVLTTLLEGLKKIVPYNAAGIFLLTNDEKEFEELITDGYEDDKIKQFLKKSHQGISSKAISEGKTVYIPNVKVEPNYFQARIETQSQVTIPIILDNLAIGAFTLESDIVDNYSEENIKLLEVVAHQASIAIVNAKLYEDSQKKNVLEKEMINASQIQKALIPKRSPDIKGFDINIYSKPSKYVAGDLVDIFETRNDHFVIAIGDVSGKGSPASILMAVLFSGLRSQLGFNYQVSEHTARLNNLLYETTSSMYYSTYFLASIDSKTKVMTYTNAGHTPPFIYRKNGNTVYLKEGGMVLGFLENEIYTQEKIQLQTDDIIVLFTDGLDEAFNLNNQEFGVNRIHRVVEEYADQPASIIRSKIIKTVQKFHGIDKEFEDDLTMMIVKVT